MSNSDDPDPGRLTLAQVLVTNELSKRPVREADYRAENAALRTLGSRLADRQTSFALVADLARGLTGADGAAISLLEQDQSGAPRFRWAHATGDLGQPADGLVSRDFSPCGIAVDRGSAQLFRYPQRHFTVFQVVRPAIVEALVVPMRWNEQPVGTIWIVSQQEHRAFDGEHVRLMESLGAMTAAVVQATRLETEPARSASAAKAAAEEPAPVPLATPNNAERVRSDWVRQIIAVQEEERRRVARELHDQLGDHLLGLELELQACPIDPLNPGRIARLQQIVSDIDGDIRRIVRDLRPTLLTDLGLASALRAHLDDWSHRSGIPFDFHSRGQLPLPAQLETTIYRVVHEALSNVARHARAHRVSVVLDQHHGHVVAIVEDDGIGFDFAARATAGDGRLGLVGMHERAALVGGTCAVESRPGAGTTVYLRLPIPASADGSSED